MSGYNFQVPPLSWSSIRDAAIELRSLVGLEDEPYLPVVDLLEKVLDHRGAVSLEVCTVEEMGDAEGFTCPNGEFIRLREDVYEAACIGAARSRFTIAHEIGHWHLHTNVPLLHARTGVNIPAFRLSEPQANQYAAELLMPPKFFSRSDTIPLVMSRHGVSASAAEFRLDYLQREGLFER